MWRLKQQTCRYFKCSYKKFSMHFSPASATYFLVLFVLIKMILLLLFDEEYRQQYFTLRINLLQPQSFYS